MKTYERTLFILLFHTAVCTNLPRIRRVYASRLWVKVVVSCFRGYRFEIRQARNDLCSQISLVIYR